MTTMLTSPCVTEAMRTLYPITRWKYGFVTKTWALFHEGVFKWDSRIDEKDCTEEARAVKEMQFLAGVLS